MIQSMTAYGRAKKAFPDYNITVEMKSVNHRFLDINLRIPRTLNFAEDSFRKEIGKYLTRGHVEVTVTYRNTRTDCCKAG